MKKFYVLNMLNVLKKLKTLSIKIVEKSEKRGEEGDSTFNVCADKIYCLLNRMSLIEGSEGEKRN